ncbi:MAG: metallopeptidase family protein [Actinobacteria bacterium]|nr:metallopeptidase family protein [Actinomycetota bacterium]
MRRSQFERIVDEALESLPQWVVDAVNNLHVVVEPWPTREQDPDGEGILGIYEGVSLLERGVDYSGYLPDRIVVFMGPHLDLGLSKADLKAEIRTTVLHEVAHHLGIDDERLTELGWD